MLTLLALQMASKRPDGDETERAFSELLTLRPDLASICTPELAAVVAEEAAALSVVLWQVIIAYPGNMKSAIISRRNCERSELS